MTDEMRHVIIAEARQQYRRWSGKVPGARLVRQWLQDSLGFEGASASDAKSAQTVLRSEFRELRRSNPARRNPKHIVIRNAKSVTVKQNPDGTVGIKVLR